jgi:ATP-dependent Lon protease
MVRKIGKNPNIKNLLKSNDCVHLENVINEKITNMQDIIRNTILSIKSSKNQYIFSNNDSILSISLLSELYENIITIKTEFFHNKNDPRKIIDSLQKINEKLMMIICGFGTKYMKDLLYINFYYDYNNIKIDNPLINAKFELIKNHVQPIGCKIINWKPNKLIINNPDVICINKITEEIISIEDSNSFECFEIDKSIQSFHQKTFGICVVIHNELLKKTIIINGITDDLPIECFTNDYISYRKNEILSMVENYDSLEKEIILRILDSFTLKDYLIFGNDDLNKKMICVITEINIIKRTKLDNTIKRFLDLDAYLQRSLLINLLIYNNDDEIQYLCYILYDLLYTSNSNDNNDSNQRYIFESLPLKFKKSFKDVVQYTAKYTNDMMQKYDIHKITLEQQIYLMKADDIVKEKAIIKLKEIKSRSDETGLKAKQYLEGLLKIPFYFYREEPILKKIKEINKNYIRLSGIIGHLFNAEFQEKFVEKQKKEKYSLIEITNNLTRIDSYIKENVLNYIKNIITSQSNKQVLNIINHINTIKKSKKEKRIVIVNKNKYEYISNIMDYLNENKENKTVVSDIFDTIHTDNDIPHSLHKCCNDISQIKSNAAQIESTIKSIENILDDSIYSHKHAKNQIIKIIAQWINGEQTGYCFGFEGCPGIGKTSLAKKGLSNCLKDEDGKSRPFAFIALGGSSNGSLLEGHGYTYMNSTWGRIVDILMETKCMNPIIYIDELDKVSKTENGKEIIGIFTHLIDQTQNDKFQDKYFSGIDIDLSKALFIFSYNDPDKIDRVLLDRIHRIKFDNLSLNDKLVISQKYLIPEINKKMGFENIVEISDEMIEYIIVNYTMEPGVRKLKEVIFDLFGEINLSILKPNVSEILDIPVVITKENIETKYLIKYNKIIEKSIHLTPEIGIINGLWANSMGNGGIIQIQTLFFPSSTFLELKLTGLQGDVMKESMNVAKSLAWSLTDSNIKKEWIKMFDETKDQGLHIHCPEGSISKDGPSAGAAITVAIYSLLNKIPIKNDIALTGEINLSGEITAIGGLDNKITGGIRSGITTFLYPKMNNNQFNEWKRKDSNDIQYENVRFIEVSNIYDVFKHVFFDTAVL